MNQSNIISYLLIYHVLEHVLEICKNEIKKKSYKIT